MSAILLDRNGDADLPTGCTLVATERAFLEVAGREQCLMVRGAALCDWAATFFAGRQIPIQETESPLEFLHDLCPELTPEQAAALLARIRPQLHTLERPWRLTGLLQLLYPNALWDDFPSPAHAAAWLLWLNQAQPAADDAPLRAALAQHWQQLATGPEADPYGVNNRDAATIALMAWLDVEADNPYATLRPFPGEVPTSLVEAAKARWKKILIQTRGEALTSLLGRPLVKPLRHALVQVAYDHFSKQPKHLTAALFAKLVPALTTVQQDKLRRLVPPPPPPDLPTAPVAMTAWFREHYVPYRLWQVSYGDEAAAAQVQSALRAFATWYLEQYRTALVGGPLAQHLAFNRIAALRQTHESSITLVVVLDGLQIADAQQLLRSLDESTNRLTFVTHDVAFAPLPTVTEFCKDSLFRGVPPVHIPNVAPLGAIEADLSFPLEKLNAARPGDLVFWRVMEPDSTYHERNTAAKLSHEVEAALDSVAAKLAEVVETLDAKRNFRVVITTDHGRLLGRSPRTLLVPAHMQSHGRAAWGNATVSFPSSGYVLEEEIAYLHRDAFALPTDAAVVVSERAFLTADGHTGMEVRPHGGISPEEVMIPWFVALRDFSTPELEVQLAGHGRAEASGRLEIAITNSGGVAVTCTGVVLNFEHRRSLALDLQLACSPNEHTTSAVEILDWPTVKATQAVTAMVQVILPNGQGYALPAESVVLTSEEMYTRTDILEGLDL